LVSVRRTPLVDPAGPAGAEVVAAAEAGAEPAVGCATDSTGTVGVSGTDGGLACSNVVGAGFSTLGTLGTGVGTGVGAEVGAGSTVRAGGLAGAGAFGCGERSVA